MLLAYLYRPYSSESHKDDHKSSWVAANSLVHCVEVDITKNIQQRKSRYVTQKHHNKIVLLREKVENY